MEPMTPEQLRAQIQAGPQTQAALDQAFATYSPAQLYAAFPEFASTDPVRGLQQYEAAAAEAAARNQANSGPTTNAAPAATPTDDWMSEQWYNPNVMPQNFDWQRYIGANQDLGAAGIDTQEEAMRHYFNYGQQEGRNIGALTPQQSGDLSPEDYRAALTAYREATGDDRVFTGVNADGSDGGQYGLINDWINKNYIPQGKFKTDYTAAKPADTFQLLNELKTSSRPPEQLASIRKAWDANKDNPGEMRKLMEQYGVTLGDLSQATGETYSQLNNWVKNGNLLGVVGFSVNRPGAYDKYKSTTTPKFDPNATVVAGPGTPESRRASYEASQQRAPNTFDPVAYAKDPEAYAKKMREQGGLAGLVAEKATSSTPSGTTQAATKITPANFESEYNRLRSDPNLNEDQMRTFLTDSLKDPIIKEKLGSQLQPTLDELNRPPRERMLGQIGNQQKALGGKYYQGVFADPKTMADVLEKKGVKSLADLGQKEKFRTTEADIQYTTKDGKPLRELEDGSLAYVVEAGDNSEWVKVPKKEATATYGKYKEVASGDNTYNEFTPLSEAEKATLKDGKYQESLGNIVINKRTGEELTDATRQLAFQSSSGGLKEKKNWLTVEFTKDGTPVLVASSEKAGLGKVLQDVAPLASVMLPFVLPGIGSALSSGLASAGGSALASGSLANAALTQGIMSGGIGALTGKDFGKSFLSGVIGNPISAGIGMLLPAGMDPNVARAITGAGTGVVKGALQGGDLDDLLKQGVLSGLTSYGLGEATKNLGLTPQQLNMATGVVAPLIQGKKIDPFKLLTSVAAANAKDAITRKNPEARRARGGLLEGPAPVKVPGNAYNMDPRMFSGIASNLMARSM
jgi:hypothetical protein